MKRALALAGAFLLGYALSAVALLIWAGMKLYEDWNDDDEA